MYTMLPSGREARRKAENSPERLRSGEIGGTETGVKTYYVDKLEENAKSYPERPALTLDFHENTLSYRMLWEQSGRVYAALKQMGIGREDVVMLYLPRHPMMLSAMLGVLRAGAAVTMVEASYPQDRVDYIRSDCGVRLTIDRSFYEKAMECPPLTGREPLHPHDACFIFYTSGTTGKPKGILHEYGKLDWGISGSVPDEDAVDFAECERFAFIPPFHFSAVMIHALPELYKANTLYILTPSISKNFKMLHALLEQEAITSLFLSPSILRIYNEGFAGVRSIMTGSEPASGLYLEGREIIVHYAMTESLYCVSRFPLKRACEDAPIATKETGKNILLLGDDGFPVKDGELGEICFPDPYFRGYIHMPQKTAELLQDGIFHSGDLGYRDENGDIFIKGRADDMIKINGNRIEPGEIEGAARELSGLRNVIAKGFVGENRSYVALYYLAGEAGDDCLFRDAALARKKMGERLPAYMIPSYFIPIETLPLNANGKISRKLLPEPRTDTFRKAGRAPAGKAERDFCEVMAEVLSLDRVGVDDDFYEIGGDSISAIRMITACAERGYDITVGDLMQARTAASLAGRIPAPAPLPPLQYPEREQKARRQPKPLLAGQELYRQIFEKYPTHSSVCVPIIAVLKKDTDLMRLKDAVNKVIAHHPALLSRLRREPDGSFVQLYDEDSFTAVAVEEMTAEESKQAVRTFLQPVDLTRDRLYAAKLISTSEKNLFLLSVHHIMGDGTANKLLLDEIAACYLEPEKELPPDFYYTLCEEEAGEKAAALKKEAEARYTAALKEIAGQDVLRPDLPGPDLGSESFFQPAALPRSEKYHNRTFLAACLMAMAECNGCDSALAYATYHGRDRRLKKDSVGCFTVLLPVFGKELSRKGTQELLNDVQQQLDFAAAHGEYPALTESGLPLDQTVIFNWQHGTMDFGAFRALADFVSMLRRENDQPNCLFNVGILDKADADRLDFYCNYPKGMYSAEKVKQFASSFLESVRRLTQE